MFACDWEEGSSSRILVVILFFLLLIYYFCYKKLLRIITLAVPLTLTPIRTPTPPIYSYSCFYPYPCQPIAGMFDAHTLSTQYIQSLDPYLQFYQTINHGLTTRTAGSCSAWRLTRMSGEDLVPYPLHVCIVLLSAVWVPWKSKVVTA